MEPVAPQEDWNINPAQLQLGECIGQGSFGQVFKAKFLGIDVAVKKILQSVEQAQEFEHEVAVLKYVEGCDGHIYATKCHLLNPRSKRASQTEPGPDWGCCDNYEHVFIPIFS